MQFVAQKKKTSKTNKKNIILCFRPPVFWYHSMSALPPQRSTAALGRQASTARKIKQASNTVKSKASRHYTTLGQNVSMITSISASEAGLAHELGPLAACTAARPGAAVPLDHQTSAALKSGAVAIPVPSIAGSCCAIQPPSFRLSLKHHRGIPRAEDMKGARCPCA